MESSMVKWLAERPKWLQFAAKSLLEYRDIDEELIKELTELCQQEADDEFPDTNYCISENVFSTQGSEEIRLCSISEITGVNRLAPQKALEFGTSNISIVYGHNGSGKSSYVRLLKHICGARECIMGKLHKNVFVTEDIPQKAKISFLKNDLLVKYEWQGKDFCEDLSTVDIFDTSFGRVFIGSEDEVSYEPPVLSFLSALIKVSDKVGAKLGFKAETYKSKLPSIPNDFLGSAEAYWFGKIDENTTVEEVEKSCCFTPDNLRRLNNIQKRISEQSPVDKAMQFDRKRDHAENIIRDIKDYLNQLSDEKCKIIITAIKESILKKSVARAAANEVFNNVQLEGIGSDVWKELWSVARKYSSEVVYKKEGFPVVSKDSVCVLCHQPLSEEARKRFISFELYIKGEAQKQAEASEIEVKKLLDIIPDIPTLEAFQTKIDAAGIDKPELVIQLTEIIRELQVRKTSLESLNTEVEMIGILNEVTCLEEVQKISEEYKNLANKYSEDAKQDNRKELEQILKSLKTNQWLAEQKGAILEEVNRIQELRKIQEAKKKTISTAISKKKGELAEMLITDAFVQRFNNELRALGASRLKVKLIKTKVSKGKVLHTLQLDGASQAALQDILSEGETRIVSIAAFLADVTGRNYSMPFIFDDPISSLDQDYEELVVQRLCTLSSQRQVIIFTHRLSLLGLIQDYAKKENVEPKIICIREESWGTGEPGDTPLFAKKPLGALNNLIDHRLVKAKKLYSEYGREIYEPHAKALCSDFRILIERMIECELISGVVERYRRAINTMGKIDNLAKISEADCMFFDELMTKYSRYEHSQPQEAPVLLPEPNELECDFNRLKQWQGEFKKRAI